MVDTPHPPPPARPPMHIDDVVRLFDYLYWSRDQVLTRAALAPPDVFVAPEPVTARDLRATLVHELDVEWSWRERLSRRNAGTPAPEEQELRPDEFDSVAAIERRWRQDEAAMRSWLASLTDAELAAPPLADRGARNALGAYLIHVVVHGIQQLRDASLLLSRAGLSPGDVEFLDFADDVLAPQRSADEGPRQAG